MGDSDEQCEALPTLSIDPALTSNLFCSHLGITWLKKVSIVAVLLISHYSADVDIADLQQNPDSRFSLFGYRRGTELSSLCRFLISQFS